MDLDMVLGSSPDPDITLDLGDKETAHINLLFPAFTSSVLTLSIANEAFCFSFFQFLHHLAPSHMASCLWPVDVFYLPELSGLIWLF